MEVITLSYIKSGKLWVDHPRSFLKQSATAWIDWQKHTEINKLHITSLVRGSFVHVKSGSFVHVRSWSSVHVTFVWFCHCISVTWFFLLLFILYIITQLITVWVFSSHLCVGFLFLGLHSAPSPPSPPPLFLLSLNFTQVLSHNAHNSSHTTPLLSQLT